MKRELERKQKKLTRNQRKIIVITVIILILLFIILGVIKLVKNSSLSNSLTVENITSNTINIKFSTREIVCDNVKITLTTTTNYDIYYYIDLKSEETAEDNNILNEITVNNTVITNTTNDISNDSIDNVNTISNNVDSVLYEPVKEKIDNSLYKKYNNGIIVENNATIYLKYANGKKFSDSAYSFEVNNIDKQGPKIGEIKTSATDSSITVSVEATDNSSSNFTYFFKLSENEEFTCTDNVNEYTFTDLEENKLYTIYVKVADEFGNESEAVTDCTSSKSEIPVEKQKYYIKINIAANTVTIYSTDENNEYTKPVKAMVCSTGKATPQSGTYNITYKYRWLALFGNVYGQYSTRIVGSILFHSVPYYKTEPNTLKYEEYDKLGTKASAGCIRLTVEDAKWIYDNVASGSTVEFYSDANNPGPLGKPTAQKISNNEYRDWDPTDPDPRNPWLGGSGEIIGSNNNNDEEENNNNSEITNNEIENNNNSNNEINNNIIDNSISNETSNSTSNSVFGENEIPWGTDD